jgi:hypothetical protein
VKLVGGALQRFAIERPVRVSFASGGHAVSAASSGGLPPYRHSRHFRLSAQLL